MIALLVITNGRHDLLARTLASAAEMLAGPITCRVMVNDSPAGRDQAAVEDRYPDFDLHVNTGGVGFGGAIRAGWAVLATVGEPFVFHLEDDFTFRRRVPLVTMAALLGRRPQLAQLALERQPWNDAERAAGGVLALHAAGCTVREFGPHCWREHRQFWTTNPSLYRRTLTERGWPDGGFSEGRFAASLFADDPETVCGYWGWPSLGPWVTHIGDERAEQARGY